MRDILPAKDWRFTCDFTPLEQQAIALQVLAGRSVKQVATATQLSQAQVRRILHHICLHANPDLYCDTMKVNAKQHAITSTCASAEPSVSFLRQHRRAFGYVEEVGA